MGRNNPQALLVEAPRELWPAILSSQPDDRESLLGRHGPTLSLCMRVDFTLQLVPLGRKYWERPADKIANRW